MPCHLHHYVEPCCRQYIPQLTHIHMKVSFLNDCTINANHVIKMNYMDSHLNNLAIDFIENIKQNHPMLDLQVNNFFPTWQVAFRKCFVAEKEPKCVCVRSYVLILKQIHLNSQQNWKKWEHTNVLCYSKSCCPHSNTQALWDR